MNDTVNAAEGFLSKLPMGDKIGQVLIALVVLIIGLIIAKWLRNVVARLLQKQDWLHRSNEDGTQSDLATPLSRLFYYVILLFVLMTVLGIMGLTDVFEPLKNMANEVVGYIPNIIGAGIVGFAGFIIARIVSDLVRIPMTQVDQQLTARTGVADFQLASVVCTLVFAAILLPVVVAALGILDIEAISAPATAMVHKLMAAIPNIIAAVLILAISWFVARFVTEFVISLLDSMHIDELPAKIGLNSLFSAEFRPTHLVRGGILFFAMLTAATAAVEQLDINIISNIMAKVLQFGGGILIGAIILIVGNFLSVLAHRALATSNVALANIARFAILGLVLAMGLRAMGLADNIVNMAFGFTIGAVAVAAALAFGLGGRNAASQLAEHWVSRITGR